MRNQKSLHNLCRNKMSEQFKGKNATLKVRDQQIGESYDSRPTLWMGRPGRWRGANTRGNIMERERPQSSSDCCRGRTSVTSGSKSRIREKPLGSGIFCWHQERRLRIFEDGGLEPPHSVLLSSSRLRPILHPHEQPADQ